MAQVSGPVVDQRPRPLGLGGLQLLGRRRDGRHRGAEEGTQLHGRQSHATAGPEDDQLLARLQEGDRPQHTECGAVGHPEGGHDVVAHAVGRAGQRPRRNGYLLGEGADEARAEDAVPDGDSADIVGHGLDGPGELASGHERRGHAHLVPVGDDQDVGKVDGRGHDTDPCLTGIQRRLRQLLHDHGLGLAVGPADGGAHVSERQLAAGGDRQGVPH